MRKLKTIALSALALLSALAAFLIKALGDRAKKAEAENKTLHEAFSLANEKTERLRKAYDEISKTEEAANAERKELAQTPDSGLVDRANKLF
jgi:predicted nuclease with TOPRIM domain